VCQVDVPSTDTINGKTLGLDLNVRSQVLSNGKFFHTKEFEHRKEEFRKGNGRKNIDNFTRNYIHQLTNDIVSHLVAQDVKVLRLERLTNLRRRSGKSWGKENRNYKVNNCLPYFMIRSFLEYKCTMVEIKVEYVNPAHTSDTCYKCGSTYTLRFPREILNCYGNTCYNIINSDLNGARNIATGMPVSMSQRLTRSSSATKVKAIIPDDCFCYA
jgi:IS605 OrfB family transposase